MRKENCLESEPKKGSKRGNIQAYLMYKLCNEGEIDKDELMQMLDKKPRSMDRYISDLKVALDEYRDQDSTLANVSIERGEQKGRYKLTNSKYLDSTQIIAIIKLLIGSRAFEKREINLIYERMCNRLNPSDKERVRELLKSELISYNELTKTENDNPNKEDKTLIEILGELIEAIHSKKIIKMDYYKMSKEKVKPALIPITIIFSEYYFYLVAETFETLDGIRTNRQEKFFRVDRIKNLEVTKETYNESYESFSLSDFKARNVMMFPGEKVLGTGLTFEFWGLSVNAILDKLPGSKIIKQVGEGKEAVYTINTPYYSRGIKMFLLSQGGTVKVIAPEQYVDEFKKEIRQMCSIYEHK